MVRGPVSMVVAGVISLTVVALVAGGGPQVFDKVLPESAVAWLDDMGNATLISSIGGGSSTANSGDPLEHLQDGSGGWRADDKIAALPGGGAAFITDVLTAQKTRLKAAKPADVLGLEEVAGCTFTPPRPGSLVAHARIGGDSGLDLGLATYGDADLAKAVQVLVNVYRSGGGLHRSSLSDLRYQSYDIAVTETAGPVYLVLETGPQSRVFNLHLAPGARVERVVLIGGDQIGVANLPEGVPVEAMRAAKAENCGFRPFYALNPGHLFYQSIAAGAIRSDEAEEKKRHFAELEATWDATFRQAFGTGAKESLAGGWDSGTVAVAGGIPATPEGRAVYAPIDGAVLRVTMDRYVEFEGQDPEQGFDARVKAMATEFAWGDLQNLRQGVAW